MTKTSQILLGLAVLAGATLTFMSPLVFSASPQDPQNGALDTPARKALEKARTDAWFNKRVPHPACPNCYKVDSGLEGIFESVPGTDHVISRDIPDPEPLAIGELRPDRHPETGEPLWYKGHQAFVGPTDEENVSVKLPVPMIVVKRIKYKHERELFKIPGVHGVGIGESGIVVLITPDMRANRSQIPSTLDGISVSVQEAEVMSALSHVTSWYRPLPIGAGISTLTGGLGSVGPHVVRDISDVGSCCYLYTLTNSHVLGPADTNVPIGAIYQPAVGSTATYGWFGYRFIMTSCVGSYFYCAINGTINDTRLKPDAGAIGHPFNDLIPMNSPCNGAEKPVRRMQYGTGSYVNGPIGIIRVPTASCTNCFKNWGVFSHGGAGSLNYSLTELNQLVAISSTRWVIVGPSNIANVTSQDGDSGGLLAWNSTKDVVGLVFAGTQGGGPQTGYIRLDYIKTAFYNAGVSFDHYWGTDTVTSRPSNSQTDPLFPFPCSN
jgi:hypothetical protein